MVMMMLETEYYHRDSTKSSHKAEHTPTEKSFKIIIGSTLKDWKCPFNIIHHFNLYRYIYIYYRIELCTNDKSLVNRPIYAINIPLHISSS